MAEVDVVQQRGVGPALAVRRRAAVGRVGRARLEAARGAVRARREVRVVAPPEEALEDRGEYDRYSSGLRSAILM